MYVPHNFIGSGANAESIIDTNPFAALLTCDDQGEPFVSHLPIIRTINPQDAQSWILKGHMARANPQWRHLQERPIATLIFSGPHAYITPNWYRSGRDVPTWNYTACHVRGTSRLIDDFNGLVALLSEMTEIFERSSPKPWSFELPDDLIDPASLVSAIVGFEIVPTKIEAKLKLSQNRNRADQSGVVDGLRSRKGEMSDQVAEMIAVRLSATE